jgi:plastocyanin
LSAACSDIGGWFGADQGEKSGADRGPSVHVIRIIQHDRGNSFDPVELAISTGDAVRFVLTGGRPESVVFDTAGVTLEAAGFIRDRSMDWGVLLVEPGQSHEISFRGAPPGRYPFRSIPHAAEGMEGVIVIPGPGENE